MTTDILPASPMESCTVGYSNEFKFVAVAKPTLDGWAWSEAPGRKKIDQWLDSILESRLKDIFSPTGVLTEVWFRVEPDNSLVCEICIATNEDEPFAKIEIDMFEILSGESMCEREVTISALEKLIERLKARP